MCAFVPQIDRIRCPACGEEDPEKLPSFSAPQHAGVRVEACESSKTYVKSIDLTLDARRGPEIDDLVALSMDLWAVSQDTAGSSRDSRGCKPRESLSTAPSSARASRRYCSCRTAFGSFP